MDAFWDRYLDRVRGLVLGLELVCRFFMLGPYRELSERHPFPDGTITSAIEATLSLQVSPLTTITLTSNPNPQALPLPYSPTPPTPHMCVAQPFEKHQWRIGHSMVFMRAGPYSQLEDMRLSVLLKSASVLSSRIRRYL